MRMFNQAVLLTVEQGAQLTRASMTPGRAEAFDSAVRDFLSAALIARLPTHTAYTYVGAVAAGFRSSELVRRRAVESGASLTGGWEAPVPDDLEQRIVDASVLVVRAIWHPLFGWLRLPWSINLRRRVTRAAKKAHEELVAPNGEQATAGLSAD